jgi:glycosyltransferase involved in cell wall biosynthesis
MFGDVKARHKKTITEEKEASIDTDRWSNWDTIDQPGTRIRIVWILHDYVPYVNAGSEICAHTMNQHLLKKPYLYDIWVGSPGYSKKTFEGVRCFDLYDTPTLVSVLKDSHILMSHSYFYRKQALWISHQFGVPFVEWVHTDNYVRAVGSKWYDPRLTGRQWAVFNSESLKASRPDLPRDSIRIVRPPVDYRDYGIEKQEAKYITLSNVNENKGGPLLIQLAKAMPDCEFLGIIGGYRKQIVDKTLPNLRYIEHTTQIKDVYAKTWVLIMPSIEETWGRTAVEAMSSGIPIVVSPTPGLKECCENAALYCDRNDLRAWVKTIRKLKTDREFYNQRSAAALQRARSLDPTEEMARLEEWIQKDVLKSAVHKDRVCTTWQQMMLFR